MNICNQYECLRDATRLRILNLLLDGPLCVCHLGEILNEAQPKISRHLKNLREVGEIASERCHNWTICRISVDLDPFFETNFAHLRKARARETVLAADTARRSSVWEQLVCGEGDATPVSVVLREFGNSCCASDTAAAATH